MGKDPSWRCSDPLGSARERLRGELPAAAPALKVGRLQVPDPPEPRGRAEEDGTGEVQTGPPGPALRLPETT